MSGATEASSVPPHQGDELSTPPPVAGMADARPGLRRKRRRLLLGGVVALIAGGVGLWYGVVRKASDLDRMVGEWQITRAGDRPGATTPLRIRVVHGDGDTYFWTYVVDGHNVSTHRMSVNQRTHPKEIDLTLIERNGQPVAYVDGAKQPAEVKQIGIYALDGDTLKVVLAPARGGEPRPAALDDPDGLPALVLTRVK